MMRNMVTYSGNPELQSFVEGLLHEEFRTMVAERRDASRKPLARPVEIELRDGESVFQAFMRDISDKGVGVIGLTAFRDGDMARIRIGRPGREPSVVMAECRWSKPYNHRWFLSGWNLLSVIKE